MVRDDIFTGSLAVFKNRGEPRCAGRAAPIQAGESLPPSAAKNVRTIFNIVHQREKVNNLEAASLRSATKLNGIFQSKFNFWFCVPLSAEI